MAGLYLTRTANRDVADERLAMAGRQYARHGFGEPAAIALPGWDVRHWGYAMGGPDTLLVAGDDLVAVAGTPTFAGKRGAPALAALLAAFDHRRIDWESLGGQFSMLIRKAGRSFLFVDWFAAHQLHHDTARDFFSTSLLAAAQSLPEVRFDAQGVYEFAFNVVPIGDDTVFAGIATLGPRVLVELTERGSMLHALDKRLPDAATDQPLPDRIAEHRAALSRVIDANVGHGDVVQCPLSGGIDSRLLLGALRERGHRPHVYVYGDRDEDDVVFAQAIGRAAGFDVEWVDKDGAVSVTPDGFAERVATDFHGFDALPTFGNIFDNGGAAYARDKRHAGGAPAASGGCGEIWRDFFFLPDRPLSPRSVARSFFARFDRRDATGRFDPHAFLERIERKVADALGVDDPAALLSRQWIEQAYPRVRCRSLFGREISLESRLSPYIMPFLDHRVVARAMTLPMPMKQAGRFEGKLLSAIDPLLAAQPSAYGHSFDRPPGAAHVRAEWSARVRPTWLRQHSYAIQRRLRAMGDEHGGLLTPDYLGRVIDLEFPAMRQFFAVERITDRAVYRRVAALEYLAAALGGRLAT